MTIDAKDLPKLILAAVLTVAIASGAAAQVPSTTNTSVDAKLVLDAAGPEQRQSLHSVYLILCPNVGLGSGFLLDNGVMVTNVHVVGTCTEENLVGISATNEHVKFSKIIPDKDRDLALLLPSDKLSGGFTLADKDDPAPGTTVSTWGYPFHYNGVSPLLSVGYVSGYRNAVDAGKTVKHIIVNGAFNHGNSGGPLLVSHTNSVIGVVVLTYNFYPVEVKKVIDALSGSHSGLQFETTNPDGTKKTFSEAQITAMVLDEFYQKTQVMIGEAIAASELKSMIKEHSAELPAPTPVTTKRKAASPSSTTLH